MLAEVALVHAQPENPFFDYLPAIRAYLEITPAQMQSIERANEEHSQWTWSKQLRLAQVQREIAEERAKTAPDPMALGVRYVEIEAICRESAAKLVEQRAKNQNLLTDAQRTKLKTLEDALKLVPAIQQAQSLQILGEPYVSLSGAMFLQNRIASTGDRFSRTDGTGLSYSPDAACGALPGYIIPAARVMPGQSDRLN